MTRRRPRPFRLANLRRAAALSAVEPLEGRRLLATFTVNTLLDAAAVDLTTGVTAVGTISLRSAIQAADATAGPSTIILPAGTYPLTITPTGADDASTGDLNITGILTLTGAGPATTTIDAGSNDRVLSVSGGGPVAISGVEIKDGFAPRNNPGDLGGGGVRLDSGALTLTNCLVDNNRAASAYGGGAGGGIFVEAGQLILNSTTLDNNQAFSTAGVGTSTGGGLFVADETQATLTDSTVSGNTAGDALDEGNTDDGDGGGIYNGGGQVSLTNTTVTQNLALANGTMSRGGGLFEARGGTLTLVNSAVSNNRTNVTFNSDEADGGGFYNDGEVSLTNSTVSANRAGNDYGGTGGNKNGGGIYSTGQLSLTNSTISNNRAGNDYGGYGGAGVGGGIYDTGQATVTDSTVSGNSAANSGGGIASVGGTITMLDSTVSGNTSSLNGGGLLFSPTVVLQGTPSAATAQTEAVGSTITGSTIAGNSSIGIYNGDTRTLTLRNTLLAGNSGGNYNQVVGASTVSAGHNLSDDDSAGGFLDAAGDINDVAAMLGPLQNNGGPTSTQAPLPGSPVIDAGDSSAAPEIDQRGQSRIQGNGIDIGAVESSAASPPVISVGPGITASPSPATVNQDLTYVVTATNTSSAPATGVMLFFDIPAGADFRMADGGIMPVGQRLAFSLGTLAAGASVPVTITVRPTGPGTLFADAFVTATNQTVVDDPLVVATVVNAAPTTADLAIVVTTPAGPVAVGAPLTFTATVTNSGPAPATGVTLTAPVPAGSAFGMATGGVLPTGGLLSFNLGDLAVGASTPITIVVNPTGSGTVTLAATATADQSDPVTANNSATASVAVSADGPTVAGVQRFGYHAQPTSLYLTFSAPLATAPATVTGNYHVHRVGRHGGRIGRDMTPSSATYDPAAHAVTLHFAHRLNVHWSYLLTVNGQAPGGLTDPAGVALGSKAGSAGSDFGAIIDRGTLAGSSSALPVGSGAPASSKVGLSVGAVDALFNSGILLQTSKR